MTKKKSHKTKKKVVHEEKKRKKKTHIKNSKKIRTSKKNTKNSSRKKKVSKKKKNYLLFDILLSIGLTLMILLSVFFFFFKIQSVPNNSMEPVVYKEEKILINKKDNTFNRFDIVLYSQSNDIKIGRIIGLPGESIRYIDDYLYVNDLPMDEKFIVDQVNAAQIKGELFTEPENGDTSLQINEIPKDSYFILGDNRPNATDSRFFGFVEEKKINGVVSAKLLPIKRMDKY